jgi:hypothetical protein
MGTEPTTEKTNEIKSKSMQNQTSSNGLSVLPLNMPSNGIGKPASSSAVELVPSDESFHWSINNEDVILPEQRTTAIYLNRWGQAVIRQERNWDEESDPFMTIDHAHLPVVIERLQQLASAPLSREEPEPGEATGGPR